MAQNSPYFLEILLKEAPHQNNKKYVTKHCNTQDLYPFSEVNFKDFSKMQINFSRT